MGYTLHICGSSPVQNPLSWWISDPVQSKSTWTGLDYESSGLIQSIPYSAPLPPEDPRSARERPASSFGRCRFEPDRLDLQADMSVDPKVGSMIPDLSTKCSSGSMIRSDPMVRLDSRSEEIPLDPLVIFGIGSWIPSDPWWNWWCRIYDLRKSFKRIPHI